MSQDLHCAVPEFIKSIWRLQLTSINEFNTAFFLIANLGFYGMPVLKKFSYLRGGLLFFIPQLKFLQLLQAQASMMSSLRGCSWNAFSVMHRSSTDIPAAGWVILKPPNTHVFAASCSGSHWTWLHRLGTLPGRPQDPLGTLWALLWCRPTCAQVLSSSSSHLPLLYAKGIWPKSLKIN